MNKQAPPKFDFRKLKWQKQGGFLVATDDSCLYMRESSGSLISGFIFGTVFGLGGLGGAIWYLFFDQVEGAKIFGAMLLLVGLLFSFLVVSTVRRGPVLITYDRGAGEIRFPAGRLAADQVRCLTTREFGTRSAANYFVAAELHDGTYASIGPTGVSTWAMHWAKQAADWMGLPYR